MKAINCSTTKQTDKRVYVASANYENLPSPDSHSKILFKIASYGRAQFWAQDGSRCLVSETEGTNNEWPRSNEND